MLLYSTVSEDFVSELRVERGALMWSAVNLSSIFRRLSSSRWQRHPLFPAASAATREHMCPR